jgi:hypothetical protein
MKPWIWIRDPDPESGYANRNNSGSRSVSGSALNQYGSATVQKCLNLRHPCLHGLGEAEGSTGTSSGGGLGKEAALGAPER